VAIDINMAIPYLDCFAGQTDYSFYVALVRIVRIPENYDVATLQVAPAYALNFVIDELIYQQTLAVMKLRHHRGSFDDNRLDEENADQNKNHDDQKNVAKQPQTLCPDIVTGFFSEAHNFNIAVVSGGDKAKVELVFLTEIEHNEPRFDERRNSPVGLT